MTMSSLREIQKEFIDGLEDQTNIEDKLLNLGQEQTKNSKEQLKAEQQKVKNASSLLNKKQSSIIDKLKGTTNSKKRDELSDKLTDIYKSKLELDSKISNDPNEKRRIKFGAKSKLNNRLKEIDAAAEVGKDGKKRIMEEYTTKSGKKRKRNIYDSLVSQAQSEYKAESSLDFGNDIFGSILGKVENTFGSNSSIMNAIGEISNATGGMSEILSGVGGGGLLAVYEVLKSIFRVASAISSRVQKNAEEITDMFQSSDFKKFDSRLYGLMSGVDSLNTNFIDFVDDAFAVSVQSGYISSKELINNIVALGNKGIAYNLEQRALWETLSDKLVSTFEVTNETLLRLIRIQEQELTDAYMGIEAAITRTLNSMFTDSSYMNGTYGSVTNALMDTISSTTVDQGTQIFYQVQKWLGSLSSVGLSDSAVTAIASSINSLLTGDVDKLGDQGKTLLAMATAYSSNQGGGLTQQSTQYNSNYDQSQQSTQYNSNYNQSQQSTQYNSNSIYNQNQNVGSSQYNNDYQTNYNQNSSSNQYQSQYTYQQTSNTNQQVSTIQPLSFSTILKDGVQTGAQMNSLMLSIIKVLQQIYETSGDNRVVLSKWGDIFGLEMSDWKSITNLNQLQLNTLSQQNMTLQDAREETQMIMENLVSERTLVNERIQNLINNAWYKTGFDIARDAKTYASIYWTKEIGSMIETITGGGGLLGQFVQAGVDAVQTIETLFNVDWDTWKTLFNNYTVAMNYDRVLDLGLQEQFADKTSFLADLYRDQMMGGIYIEPEEIAKQSLYVQRSDGNTVTLYDGNSKRSEYLRQIYNTNETMSEFGVSHQQTLEQIANQEVKSIQNIELERTAEAEEQQLQVQKETLENVKAINQSLQSQTPIVINTRLVGMEDRYDQAVIKDSEVTGPKISTTDFQEEIRDVGDMW